jgi:hypothetical protein
MYVWVWPVSCCIGIGAARPSPVCPLVLRSFAFAIVDRSRSRNCDIAIAALLNVIVAKALRPADDG